MERAQTHFIFHPSEAPVGERDQEIQSLEQDWKQNPRWHGVKRGYSAEDVVRLRGSLRV